MSSTPSEVSPEKLDVIIDSRNDGSSVEMNTYSVNSIGNNEERSQRWKLCPPINRRIVERSFVSLLFGFVIGWCVTALVSLNRVTKNEIQELCSGNLLWDYLIGLIAVNILSAFTLGHVWYHNHFHNVRVYPNTNVPIHLVILAQVAMTAWGASIIFSECPRHHLRPLLLYSVVYVWMIWQLVLYMMFIALALCICIVFSGAAL